MPTPGEHKTVQARILRYAEAIGWTIVPREDAEQRREFDMDVPPKDRAKGRSLFFDDLLDTKVREFNPAMWRPKGPYSASFAISTRISTATGNSSSTSATGASSSTMRRIASAT